MAKSISQSVGRFGFNITKDVQTVQYLLNRVPPEEGGPKQHIKQDGKNVEQLIPHIQTFQLHHFGWSGADGRVDPDHQTIEKLNSYDYTEIKCQRFLIRQLSPNKELKTDRMADWFFWISPLNGDVKLRAAVYWLGSESMRPTVTRIVPPESYSPFSHAFLETSIPTDIYHLEGLATFATLPTEHRSPRSIFSLKMTTGGFATARFDNAWWAGTYYRHLDRNGPIHHSGSLMMAEIRNLSYRPNQSA